MDINAIRALIAENYEKSCFNMGQEPNKSIIREFKIEIPKSIKELDIVFKGNDKLNFTTRMKSSDLIILCEIFENFTELIRHIDLSYNLLDDSSIIEFSKVLENCHELESLNLQGNDIESQGASAISEALKKNKSLKYLNLDSNKIRTDGAKTVVEVLFITENLVELNLGNNEIDHNGIIAITSVLIWNMNTLIVMFL